MGEEYSGERGRREGGEEVRRRVVPGRREGRGAISYIDFGPIDRPPLMEELMSVVSERQGGRHSALEWGCIRTISFYSETAIVS